MSIQDDVRQFIVKNFYVADAAGLADDASLLDKGVIDSTGVLEVVAHLEEAYSIKVDDAELLPENLDSIARIAAFVQKKKG
ncbi:MAG: acyl carrier protein [Myxococcales bacterium]|nr:acyl carrier protein [Myxococcales bacterium]